MTELSPITLRPLAKADAPGWRHLYKGYADFYETAMTDDGLDRLWAWLLDPEHPLEGLVAVASDGRMVGLAHYRPFPETLLGQDAGFLDDLFVDPACRGHGIGKAMIEALAKVAAHRGWPFVRWITAADNSTARRLYDEVAAATDWVTYDLKTAG